MRGERPNDAPDIYGFMIETVSDNEMAMKTKCRWPMRGKAQLRFHEAYYKPRLMRRELQLQFYRAGGAGAPGLRARGEFPNHRHHSVPRYRLSSIVLPVKLLLASQRWAASGERNPLREPGTES